MLVLQHSVTSTQQSARMAVTDLSSSFGATNNRLLCFECIMAACSAAMETVQLLRVQPNWWLAACRVSVAPVRTGARKPEIARTRCMSRVVSFTCSGETLRDH